jgi:hypothetical protein
MRYYMDHHRLLLSCVCENWSDYISELEEIINRLVRIFARIFRTGSENANHSSEHRSVL